MMETYGSIRAPSVRLEVDEGEIDYHRLDGAVRTHVADGQVTLTWSLRDHRGDLLYQSSEYTVSNDGCTATFKHTFPQLDNGDTFTITQDVVVA